MNNLPLSFPVFYHGIVKDNTNLPQYDAVSILLLGIPRQKCVEVVISDAEASAYTNGQKQIKRVILSELISISQDEAERRISMLGFQDTTSIANMLNKLLYAIDISDSLQKNILNPDKNEIGFIASVFRLAIRYPSKKANHLSTNDKIAIKDILSSSSHRHTEPDKTPIHAPKKTKSPQANPHLEGEIISSQKKTNALSKNFKVSDLESETNVTVSLSVNIDKLAAFYRYAGKILNIECLPIQNQNGISLFYEMISTSLSLGLTYMSDLFEQCMTVTSPPSLFFFLKSDPLHQQIQSNNFTTSLIHEFYVSDVANYRKPDSRNIRGLIILNIESNLILNLLHNEYSMSCQISEYIASVYTEVGNIFAGGTVSAISNIINEPIFVQESDITHLSDYVNSDKLSLTGMLPFETHSGITCSAFIVFNQEAIFHIPVLYDRTNTDYVRE